MSNPSKVRSVQYAGREYLKKRLRNPFGPIMIMTGIVDTEREGITKGGKVLSCNRLRLGLGGERLLGRRAQRACN